MTIKTMPVTPSAQSHVFGLESNTAVFTSIFTKASQTIEWPGARWKLSITLPPMPYELAASWKAFLVSLRGQAGRFYGYCPDYAVKGPSGTALGTGLIKGAGQTGTSLVTDGWTVSQAKLYGLGDMIAYDTEIGRQLHMVMADVASDASGEAVISVEPPIRVPPPDNAEIIKVKPSCIMMLDDPKAEWDSNHLMHHGISFSATEVFR